MTYMSVSYTSPRRQLVRCYFRFRVFGSLMMFVTISCCVETVTTILTKLSEQTRNSSCTMPWNSPGAAPCSGTRGEFCCAVPSSSMSRTRDVLLAGQCGMRHAQRSVYCDYSSCAMTEGCCDGMLIDSRSIRETRPTVY